MSGVDESETSQEDTSQRSMEDQVKTVSDQLTHTWIEEMEGSHNNTFSHIDTRHSHQKSI